MLPIMPQFVLRHNVKWHVIKTASFWVCVIIDAIFENLIPDCYGQGWDQDFKQKLKVEGKHILGNWGDEKEVASGYSCLKRRTDFISHYN